MRIIKVSLKHQYLTYRTLVITVSVSNHRCFKYHGTKSGFLTIRPFGLLQIMTPSIKQNFDGSMTSEICYL